MKADRFFSRAYLIKKAEKFFTMISIVGLVLGIGVILGRAFAPEFVDPHSAVLGLMLIFGSYAFGSCINEHKGIWRAKFRPPLSDAEWTKEWNLAAKKADQEEHKRKAYPPILDYLMVLIALGSVIGLAMMFFGWLGGAFFPGAKFVDREWAFWGVSLVANCWVFGSMFVGLAENDSRQSVASQERLQKIIGGKG